MRLATIHTHSEVELARDKGRVATGRGATPLLAPYMSSIVSHKDGNTLCRDKIGSSASDSEPSVDDDDDDGGLKGVPRLVYPPRYALLVESVVPLLL